ncbi:MAG: acetolactate decarboxylase [Aphanocapsa lilacina HA4352-LM1]|nr:acetolactate decarboxylase [Aphanocapsa lilacina HA4352-LM1]
MGSFNQKAPMIGLSLLLLLGLTLPESLFAHPVPNNARNHTASGRPLPKPSSDVILTEEAAANRANGNDYVFTASITTAIYSALYDGTMTIKTLKSFGDIALGVPDRVDGELFAVDGRFYNIQADGTVYELADSEKVAWATTKFFKPDRVLTFDTPVSCSDLFVKLDELIPSINIMYALRIEGDFRYMHTRSIPGQTKPYISFSELIDQTTQFYNYDVKGTMVGFRFPSYMEQVNVGGFHFHFLNDAKKVGGHVNDCTMTRGRVAIDSARKADIIVPRNEDFYESALDGVP